MSDVPATPAPTAVRAAPPRPDNLHEQTVSRLNNLDAQVAAGFEASPYSYPRTHSTRDVLAAHPGELEAGQEWPEETYTLAGRVTLLRHMGKAAFADLTDEHGSLQLHLSRQETENFDPTKKIDLGDIIGVRGVPFVTRTGQLTLRVTSWQPLVKSLHPLPSKFHGLQDEELRARRRYLDLMINPERRAAFRTRSRAIRYIRNFLDEREFMEVEGPTLQVVAGGTEAKPFKTHHNALSHDFSLRISLELYLKRLLVGGFERVYEIGRNYRNEGVDRTHNPEFTMLEAYFAYGDYQDMMRLVEELLSGLVQEVTGSDTLTYGGHEISFALPFKRLDFVTALREARRAGVRADGPCPVARVDRREAPRIPQGAGLQAAGQTVRRVRGRQLDPAHLRHGRAAGDQPAGQGAPQPPRSGRARRSVRGRLRTGPDLLRAERCPGSACPLRGAVCPP